MRSKKFEFNIEPWITTNEKLEYTTNIFKLLEREMKIPSENHTATFSIIEAPEWVNVIPLTSDNKIILVEQFRHGIEQSTLELPGGINDSGEDPQKTAGRELLEETGYRGDECVNLGKVSSNPAFLTNYTHFYLIKNCQKVEDQQLDGDERINVHLMPFSDFLGMVADGQIHHSLVVAAVAKYLLKFQLKSDL